MFPAFGAFQTGVPKEFGPPNFGVPVHRIPKGCEATRGTICVRTDDGTRLRDVHTGRSQTVAPAQKSLSYSWTKVGDIGDILQYANYWFGPGALSIHGPWCPSEIPGYDSFAMTWSLGTEHVADRTDRSGDCYNNFVTQF